MQPGEQRRHEPAGPLRVAVAALALLDADSLATELEKFANSLERWKKLLEDFRPGAAEEAAQGAGGDEPAPPFGNGYLNV